MVDKLRRAGHMIYINKTAGGTSYRLGTPSKAILAAGVTEVLLNDSQTKLLLPLESKHFMEMEFHSLLNLQLRFSYRKRITRFDCNLRLLQPKRSKERVNL